jgi:5-methyltetrahydrofolate--homocysteine methyltransferase
VLTLPISTGQAEERRNAIETIEGIRLVKQQIPGCFTTLGVSNLSFGLAPHARAALHSVFLKHAVEAGLDTAIVNPAHLSPYADLSPEEIKVCEDLIFDRDENALSRLIQFFDANAVTESEAKADPTEGMSVEQRTHWKIVHRKKEGVEADIDEALRKRMENRDWRLEIEGDSQSPISNPQSPMNQGEAAVDVLNTVLLPAMKEVGDLFGSGKLILPFVLQSAEVMKKAVAHLEQYLDKVDGATKGRVVLATVYGDVHDIGKNLVHTILSNNGYTVYDLGKQVPLNTIIEKAVEVKADAIGLSALLVSTSKQMPLCVQELHRRGLSFPVLVGGAAINKQYGQRILFVGDEEPYEPGVFYCKDAFEGLETMDILQDPEQRNAFVDKNLQDALNDVFLRTTVGKDIAVGDEAGVRSDVAANNPVPDPPFWGTRVLRDIPIEEVFDLLDLDELYRLQWGARGSGEQYDSTIKNEFEPALTRLKADAKANGWIRPAAVYGYFPAQSQGNDVIIYDPAAYSSDGASLREIARFHFPRMVGRERLCLADYIRSVDSGDVDVVPLQIVTVGNEATLHFDKLQGAHEYTEAYYSHGLSVESAEAVAEWLHRRIKSELGLETGKRYSWGYGACPDLDDHATVFKLLPAKEALDMNLTEAMQLLPEQSTAAIIIHHPEAHYFAVRGSAADVAAASSDSARLRREGGSTAEGQAAETVDEQVALQRASSGEVTLAEARVDT